MHEAVNRNRVKSSCPSSKEKIKADEKPLTSNASTQFNEPSMSEIKIKPILKKRTTPIPPKSESNYEMKAAKYSMPKSSHKTSKLEEFEANGKTLAKITLSQQSICASIDLIM